MLPGDLLRRTADVYAGTNTYADRGRARCLHFSETFRSERRGTFATFLDRQQGFRFDAREGSTDASAVLWRAPEPSRSVHPHQGQVQALFNLLVRRWFAPAAATTVPSLLMPREFGRSLLDELRDPLYQGLENVGIARCHRIFGHWRDQADVTLWLDEDRFLVLRLVDRTEHPEARKAAEWREAHLRRRDQALAAGIPSKEIDQVFGSERLLAIRHWPYARPRQDSHTITRIAYDPQVGIPVDAAIFRSKPGRA